MSEPIKTATLSNIEKGIHLLWPTEWITKTMQELCEKVDSGEAGTRIVDCLAELTTEFDRRANA